MKSLKKIALTGGPSGGKTTALRHLARNIPGVYCVPEAATMLLNGGFPAPSEQHGWTYDWQKSFQVAVAALQISLEEVYGSRATEENRQLLVCDRGLIDGASYLNGGIEELAELTGMSVPGMLDQYDMVIHLPTSAFGGSYDKVSNPHRFEDANVALELDAKVLQAWEGHSNRIIVPHGSMDNKLEAVQQIVDALCVAMTPNR
jgi:predicted ATPase